MAQQTSTDHNSDADTEPIEHKKTGEARKNVVGALLEHFKKWHPEKLTNASSIQEMRETPKGPRQE